MDPKMESVQNFNTEVNNSIFEADNIFLGTYHFLYFYGIALFSLNLVKKSNEIVFQTNNNEMFKNKV